MKPVVAIDVDGTLGDYHAWFLQFAELWYGRPMPHAEDINPGLPLHKFMGTSRSTYRQCKLAFRQGGMKRSMPCYPGARDLTVGLRCAGAEVWICTTRPYLRLDNIDPDTRHWLRRNGIQYDAVIYGQHKYRELIKCVGVDRVVGVLDDLPSMAEQAVSLGIPTLIRTQPYNTHIVGIDRVSDLFLARSILETDVRKWRESNGR